LEPIELLPAPSIPTQPVDKWRSEQLAFRRMLPDLLKNHLNHFVAIHEGRVVEFGLDKLAVAQLAYARFGYQPIYVSLVTEASPLPIRLPSPRMVGRDHGE
jgi:hypothetical protein